MATVEEIVRLMKDAGIARGKADSLAADQSLDEQGLDSYDRMSLLTELEEHFKVELPNQVASQLKTLNDIVNHLNSGR
ncbi:MAG: acyl carrier protein [Planctomycetota bacterium]|nr:acyl carrier protein [Planctomycetota bacterium]